MGNLHDKHGPSFPFPAFNFFYIHPCHVFLPGFPSIPSFPGLLSLLLSVMLHHWCYQGSLAFRRRCGETLQDFCCPPGACGLSRTPQTPITPPLLSSDSKTNPSSNFPRSHCTGSVCLPRPILRPLHPTCRPLQSATGKVRVKRLF